ncbi:MAG: N-acetylmuramoyl-L-alanine amidase [Elusimicrobiota bacterium]
MAAFDNLLHADKVDGRKPKGVIVWYYGPNKRIPKGPPRAPTERLRPPPPKAVVAESRLLAERVQDALRRRGVKLASYADKGGFAVLKSDKMPSILVEVGNMRDPGEWAQMQDPAFQDRLAKGVAQGVAAYLGAVPR